MSRRPRVRVNPARNPEKALQESDMFLGDFMQMPNFSGSDTLSECDLGLLDDDDNLTKYLTSEVTDSPERCTSLSLAASVPGSHTRALAYDFMCEKDIEGSDHMDMSTGGVFLGRSQELGNERCAKLATQTSVRRFKDVSDEDEFDIADDTRSTGAASTLEKEIIVVTRPGATQKNSNSKQAVAARENRIKKKLYFAGLENSVQKLSQDNLDLKKENKQQKKQLGRLQAEVAYLKNVIANQSTLSGLLKNIQNTHGVNLSVSLRSFEDDSCADNTEAKVGQKRKGGDAVGAYRKRHCSGRSSTSTCGSNADENDSDVTESVGTSVPGSPTRASGYDFMCEKDVDGSENTDMSTGGVCLHVLGSSVSVEFCSDCNRSAAKSCSADHAYVKTSK